MILKADMMLIVSPRSENNIYLSSLKRENKNQVESFKENKTVRTSEELANCHLHNNLII